ncbi:nucleotide exchange factor GrpE [Bradyrhizobium sp. 174]|uniref:nucleotide exchange factor GrpE n=1 Tax=Bradyrhizobium sp. 174 TaxID=2782645 RepID=UPI001FF9E0C2|nr:nucleotide exchange factor GrpE [Bradyrhizobium sp. 174]MCK1571402.1 nucleotide exchange factor GrpE [Bradyrhizobium sp. 174]
MQENVTGEQAPPVEEAKERDSLQAENAALRDRLLRALADAENTRQRGERMAKDARQYAIADFARELLTVLDNLHRAIAAAEQRRADMTDDSSLLEGIKATERILTSTLERFAVRRVEALGAKFDPALHEAVMQVEDDEHDPGTVVQVLEDGYVIHERLLRPARVTVARRRQERASHSETVKPRDHDGFHHFET